MAVLGGGGVPGGVPVGVPGHDKDPGPVYEGDLRVAGEMGLERRGKVSLVEVYMLMGVVVVFKLVLADASEQGVTCLEFEGFISILIRIITKN